MLEIIQSKQCQYTVRHADNKYNAFGQAIRIKNKKNALYLFHVVVLNLINDLLLLLIYRNSSKYYTNRCDLSKDKAINLLRVPCKNFWNALQNTIYDTKYVEMPSLCRSWWYSTFCQTLGQIYSNVIYAC